MSVGHERRSGKKYLFKARGTSVDFIQWGQQVWWGERRGSPLAAAPKRLQVFEEGSQKETRLFRSGKGKGCHETREDGKYVLLLKKKILRGGQGGGLYPKVRRGHKGGGGGFKKETAAAQEKLH